MNKEYILYNLKEAQEELSRTVIDIETDAEYEYGDFVVAMSHLYHHINTAWNSQNEPKEVTDECSEVNFEKWRQHPQPGELQL